MAPNLFTKELLAAREFGSGPSLAMVNYLDRFIHRVFDHSKNADAKYRPELEDIFTCIDLATNTGHHLGAAYSPAELRTVRRVDQGAHSAVISAPQHWPEAKLV